MILIYSKKCMQLTYTDTLFRKCACFNLKNKLLLINISLQGVGRRFATLVCKKAGVDITRRAGELSDSEVSKSTAL